MEYLTVSWNVVEGIIAVSAGLAAGSVALLAFGIDSFIESISGGVLIWRLHAERKPRYAASAAALDARAARLVGLSLFVLAAYIAVDAALTLWNRERPDPSWIGILLTATSVGIMLWLARAKRSAAKALGSRALEADAFQTTACWWLSIIVLIGVGLNAAFGWWWADPVSALVVTYFVVREGKEAWEGERCCDD
ncbi:MAG: cation diffusion facilitator family transporter [Pirellulales bacterium]